MKPVVVDKGKTIIQNGIIVAKFHPNGKQYSKKHLAYFNRNRLQSKIIVKNKQSKRLKTILDPELKNINA